MAPDLVRLTTTTDFHAAAAVTPWIALGVMFQGIYLVGSIGLVITKRTTLYPIATGTAAVVSLVGYALLIPRFGLLGAAWANAHGVRHAGGGHRRHSRGACIRFTMNGAGYSASLWPLSAVIWRPVG